MTTAVMAADLCTGFGPQTPRDISNVEGINEKLFDIAPEYTALNLCNIHTHTNAEHKGPGFSLHVGDDQYGGYACNETANLTASELITPEDMAYDKVKAGDTIEVHWVHSSCDIAPGAGLGSCLSDDCEDLKLRVETQVFLVVNDENAADFMEMTYDTTSGIKGPHQAKYIPDTTGDPVQFHGSTTGPSYTQEKCSPLEVTWSVRPQCMKVDINSLNAWAKSNNVFEETGSHGVRQLVTAPELLAPIQ